MITNDVFRQVVARANLAPSIHNAQPARWRLRGHVIEVAADLSVKLPHADPTGEAIGLSCGAAVEATLVALPFAAQVEDVWAHDDVHSWSGHRMAARITVKDAANADALSPQLERRYTWRGAFKPTPPRLFGWTREDTFFVMDEPTRGWIAGLNDAASLGILRDRAFRRELLSWMRLTAGHARYRFDGLSLAALRMDAQIAKTVKLGFGPLWSVMDFFGRTAAMTAEADVTMTAPVLACFHRPVEESAVASGRAYLRLCLEAAHLDLSAWPMAALTDDPLPAGEISQHFGIGPERKLIQILRLGAPSGAQTPRARRPLEELIGN